MKKIFKSVIYLSVHSLFCLLMVGVSAYGITPGEIPEPLKPWVDWVIEGEESRDCPRIYNNEKDHRCRWTPQLALKLDEKAGEFMMTCRVYGRNRILLPGDTDLWPQHIEVNDKITTLLNDGGSPFIRLEPGTYEISGRFSWQSLPEALPLPREAGLVSLVINGRTVEFPDIDAEGRLWLKRSGGQIEPQDREDRLEIQVFRRIMDEIPMEIVTRMELKAAGKVRDVLLTGALPKGFIPFNLSGPLPARLESGGNLRMTVRPGNWTMMLSSRNTENITDLTLPDATTPWPANEIWSFDVRNQLRLVKVEGVDAVDPRQTNVPEEWAHLPAYQVNAGDTLKLNVVRRGDPEPAPDQLQLFRSIWLDFDGKGYSLQDRITGTITHGWRLETEPEIRLGQVLIDGIPQFITALSGSRNNGVEVRRGSLDLTADARYEGRISSLPAVGWDRDFQQVGAELNLPPGWKLFAMGGVDDVPDTWLSRWTLMDLFLVLISAISFMKLWHWRPGLLAITLLTLIWHEPGAPRYVWLNILASLALIRVLPDGIFRKTAEFYRNVTFIVLLLISIPFMVNQVGNGLYPQLEMPRQEVMTNALDRGEKSAPQEIFMTTGGKTAMPMTTVMEPEKQDRLAGTPADEAGEYPMPQESANLAALDPNALVQTGPGIPQWKWRSIPFKWNGPVNKDQRISLVLLSPKINLILNFLRVALLMILCVFLLKTSFSRTSGRGRSVISDPAVLVLTAILFFAPGAMASDFPGPELLDDLKTRLLSPPDCFPECAQISRMALEIDNNVMTLRLEIHAGASVALPLPGKAEQWLPEKVLLDGNDHPVLSRFGDGELWVQIDEGVHQAVMTGPLPLRENILLPLPLKPRFVTFQVKGWTVRGIRENATADDHLQLERIPEKTELSGAGTGAESAVLPPFVKIERILHLGLNWSVENRMTRISSGQTAVIMEVPLMPGESVTSEGFPVKDGRVLVNMAPEQRVITWQSSLEKNAALTLTAPESAAWTEIWKADVATLWHTEYKGLTVIHHQDPSGHRLPEWRPWPGESVTLSTMKPAGIEGQTLTIDNSRMEIKPGRRATDTKILFSLNSSRGGQHTLALPGDTELQSVLIDGKAQPVRQKGREVTLPVKPGRQAFTLLMRSSAAVSAVFKTPEVRLNLSSVNHTTQMELGRDRWVLWTAGPRLGPAVLFWGVLLVILLLALGLGKIRWTPLKTFQWFLLGVGLSQAPVFSGLLVAGWLLALGGRKNLSPGIGNNNFNFIQMGMVLLTLAAMGALFLAVQKGLLGLPEMQISGNRSTAYNLFWFQDRVDGALPASWVISVPLMAYRLLMLAWALWLAFSLVNWLRWGWECFSANGLWQTMKLPRKKKAEAKANIPRAEGVTNT
jgi:hypothetical protein